MSFAPLFDFVPRQTLSDELSDEESWDLRSIVTKTHLAHFKANDDARTIAGLGGC